MTISSSEGLFIGLMSGTSVDAVDCALVEIGANMRLRATLSVPMPADLRRRLLQLSQPGDGEIDRMGAADRALAELMADAVLDLLSAQDIAARDIVAIGSHGQTIRHRPRGETPFTLQIGDPNVLAERTGISVVADFRRRDMAAGGQGAPLAPAFHQAAFADPDRARGMVNLGGMANVSLLLPGQDCIGFDTGPGNALMDAWIERHLGLDMDRDGDWARRGRIDSNLLLRLLGHPFFQRETPKTTGREEFNLDWVDREIASLQERIAVIDVQATLLELTACTVAGALRDGLPADSEVYLCGGGSHNRLLRERISGQLPAMRVDSTECLAVPPDWVEAMAFAWLAHRTLAGLPGNLPQVTGAAHPVILGAIYRAG